MQTTAALAPRIAAARGWRSRRPGLRRAAVAALVAGAAAGAGVAAQATAQPATLKVTGHVETLLAASPDCASPTGLCFAGDVHGVISGPIRGELNSSTPTQQPGVQLVDVTATIHTRQGDLSFAHEQVIYNTTPDGRGEFAWQAQITGGTGRYAGATGYVQGAGNAPPSTGVSTSSYAGEIKLAD